MRHLSVSEIRAELRTRAQLEDAGIRDRALRRALEEGAVRRVQRNRYLRAEVWRDCWSETQHRIEVVAAAEEMRGGPAVVGYASAAVLHGLPLYRHRPAHVELIVPRGARGSSRYRARRHEEPLPESDVTEIAGIRCTSLERTAFDIARTLPWETTVAAADAALRQVSVAGRVWDGVAAEDWRARMRERLSEAAGARGIRQARQAVEFADGRAERPGESVSRVQLTRLGFAVLLLQVPVPGPNGHDYEVDIGIPTEKTFWEFDGQGKYLDEALRSGKTLEEVLLAEKRREDWIRGVTQWRMCRGEDAHIATPGAMAARLSAFGIRCP